MVEGRLKSRTYRRVKVKLPGGRTKTQYTKRKLGQPICAVCKKKLSGIKSYTSAQLKRTVRSERKTNRPYGGNLCSDCARQKSKALARQ